MERIRPRSRRLLVASWRGLEGLASLNQPGRRKTGFATIGDSKRCRAGVLCNSKGFAGICVWTHYWLLGGTLIQSKTPPSPTFQQWTHSESDNDKYGVLALSIR